MLCIALCLAGCHDMNTSAPETQTQPETENRKEEVDMAKLILKIDGKVIDVMWEENESVSSLKELCSKEELEIHSSIYGGFEQVGSIGLSLPRNDSQTVTSPGDIVLYSGDQIVVFFGSNSWAYTRLGKITGVSDEEIETLLNKDSVVLTLKCE